MPADSSCFNCLTKFVETTHRSLYPSWEMQVVNQLGQLLQKIWMEKDISRGTLLGGLADTYAS